MTVDELITKLTAVPSNTPVNVTMLPTSDSVEAVDHPVVDTSYDSVSGIFDIFIGPVQA